MNKQKLQRDAAQLQPVLHIGKAGIEGVVEELKQQLKMKKMVKVKFLKTALAEKGRHELADDLATLTNSELIEVRGNTAVYRRKG